MGRGRGISSQKQSLGASLNPVSRFRNRVKPPYGIRKKDWLLYQTAGFKKLEDSSEYVSDNFDAYDNRLRIKSDKPINFIDSYSFRGTTEANGTFKIAVAFDSDTKEATVVSMIGHLRGAYTEPVIIAQTLKENNYKNTISKALDLAQAELESTRYLIEKNYDPQKTSFYKSIENEEENLKQLDKLSERLGLQTRNLHRDDSDYFVSDNSKQAALKDVSDWLTFYGKKPYSGKNQNIWEAKMLVKKLKHDI